LWAEDSAANHEMMLLHTKDSIDVITRRFPALGFDNSHVTFWVMSFYWAMKKGCWAGRSLSLLTLDLQ
jgi:hypothetical protein